MPTNLSKLLSELSRNDIQKLLVAKEEVDTLEARRAELQKELSTIEKRLAKLIGETLGSARATTRKTGKKAAGKTAGKAPRKTARKTTRKAAAKGGRKAAAKPRVKLEDVVVAVLQKQGDAMPFKEILEAITTGKLFKSRSANFDNVLRRTLSTSDKVKRVSRGVYGL